MKKYFITGGAGFIGSHLTRRLLAGGNKVTALDNFSTGSPDNIAPFSREENYSFFEDDVVTPEQDLALAMKDCDVIIHLAAAVGVELVVNDPMRTIKTNVAGTEHVLDAAAKYGRKRVIIASTSEVYGKSTQKLFRETDDLLIGQPIHSRWSYACSKLLDEFYLFASHQSGTVDGVTVRFFNTVGPGQTGRYGMVIPRLVKQALAGKALTVYGDGNQSRCFCHVADTARAVELLAGNPEASGKIFNIGSQNSITIMELAKKIIQHTGSSSVIELIPYEKAYQPGFEDMRRRMPDISAVSQLTGWHPEKSLDEIIDDVIGHFRNGTAEY